MHDTDDFDDEHTGPSRSQLRREALDIFKMAEMLATLTDSQLARVPLDEDVRAEVVRTRSVTSHIARKRQTQFLAKQLRKLDDEALEPVRHVLDQNRSAALREAAAMHRLEQLRERLLDGGDEALSALIADQPRIDRQHVRQLVRNAVAERKANKPPHAYRELLRTLRLSLMATAADHPAADGASPEPSAEGDLQDK